MKKYSHFLLALGLSMPVFALAQTATSTTTSTSTTSSATSTSSASTASGSVQTVSSCELMNPQAFVQNTVNQVLGVLTQDQSKIATNFSLVQLDILDQLKPSIGINAMSRFVVPPAIWAAASHKDRAAFNAAFLQFIALLYTEPLRNFSNQTIEVFPTRVSWQTQQTVQINSVIRNPSAGPQADISVSFILIKHGCTWMFVDFVVESMSALNSLQQQIQSIVSDMSNPALSDLTRVIIAHNQTSSS